MTCQLTELPVFIASWQTPRRHQSGNRSNHGLWQWYTCRSCASDFYKLQDIWLLCCRQWYIHHIRYRRISLAFFYIFLNLTPIENGLIYWKNYRISLKKNTDNAMIIIMIFLLIVAILNNQRQMHSRKSQILINMQIYNFDFSKQSFSMIFKIISGNFRPQKPI